MQDILTTPLIPSGMSPTALLACIVSYAAALVPLDVALRSGFAWMRGRPSTWRTLRWQAGTSICRCLLFMATLALWPFGVALVMNITIGVIAHLLGGVLNGIWQHEDSGV